MHAVARHPGVDDVRLVIEVDKRLPVDVFAAGGARHAHMPVDAHPHLRTAPRACQSVSECGGGKERESGGGGDLVLPAEARELMRRVVEVE